MLYWTLLLTLVVTMLFDLTISSKSIAAFRVIYDAAFVLISWSFIYSAALLFNEKSISLREHVIKLPKKVLLIASVIANIYAILSTFSLNNPSIGYLSEDMLKGCVFGLFYLLIFLLILSINAVLFHNILSKYSDLSLGDIAEYILGIVAIETCLSMYFFHMMNLHGIRLFLLMFHTTLIIIAIWNYLKAENIKEILIKIKFPEILLLVFSIGFSALFYAPRTIYNLYSDVAPVVGNILSIVVRKSLIPYYLAEYYYSPTMGFVSVFFIYITGLNNILLAANLPFLIAYLLLPFLIYNFLEAFVVDDFRVALIGAMAATLMDGLAILLLPKYISQLTPSIIAWKISTRTMSLYFSNTCMWVVSPYETFAATVAIASCSILRKKKLFNYVLGGTFFFLSFMNPRFSFISLLLIFLLIMLKKINTRNLLLFISSAILSSGFTTTQHLYKILLATVEGLYTKNLVTLAQYKWVNTILINVLLSKYEKITLLLLLIVSVGIFAWSLVRSSEITEGGKLVTHFYVRTNYRAKGIKLRQKNFFISMHFLLSIIVIVLMFSYISYYAYFYDSVIFFRYTLRKNTLLYNLNAIILRYHILLCLFLIEMITFRFSKKIFLTLLLLFLAFYFGGIIARAITLAPILFVTLSSPYITLLIQKREIPLQRFEKKILTLIILLMIFAGVLSSTLYSATIKTQYNEEFSDLPCILNILLKRPPGDRVYSPSYYKYYVRRVVRMAHLKLSDDPNCQLYLIDKDYTKEEIINLLLNNDTFLILYNGNRFILLQKSIEYPLKLSPEQLIHHKDSI